MIRAVFFDLDGTLYDRDAVIARIAKRQHEEFRSQLAGITEDAFLERVIQLDRHGHGRTPRLHHHLISEFGLHDDLADTMEAFFRARYAQSIEITEDTRSTLETLRSRGTKLGIITNGPEMWQSLKIEASGVAHLFDTILISGREGIEKPDPRIFARAMERCGVGASDSMFVGDHPIADIEGARNAGLLAVWKRMPYWNVPDDVPAIDRISDVLKFVGSASV